MTIGLYTLTVPVIERILGNLELILEKGAAYLAQRNLPDSVLLDARLYPDMFSLTRQVQSVSDISKGAVARLASIEIPKYEDHEHSFAELNTRLSTTAAFVRSVDRAAIDAGAERAISIVGRDRTMNFTGLSYLTGFVLPNLYFHSAISYAILRHSGVEVGKRDFLGAL
jgi:hypothetical protein